MLSNNASADSLIASLYGLIGVILGIVFSLLPSRLLDERNTAAKHVDILGLLTFEIDVIKQMCTERIKFLSKGLQEHRLQLPAAADIVNAAWSTACNAADFMTSIPKEFAEDLAHVYLGVDYLNKSVEQSVFVLTPLWRDAEINRKRIESGERGEVEEAAKNSAQLLLKAAETYYKGMIDRAQTLLGCISNVQPKMKSVLDDKRKNKKVYDRAIWVLIAISAVLTLLLIYALVSAISGRLPTTA